MKKSIYLKIILTIYMIVKLDTKVKIQDEDFNVKSDIQSRLE